MSEVQILVDNTDLVVKEITEACTVALEKIGLVAEGHAIAYETAVDTGRLRNSITHQVDEPGKYVAIGTNVEYAPYIELGHHSYPGLHFLKRAAADHGDEYREILKETLENK